MVTNCGNFGKTMKRIELTQGFEALVDDEDYERVNQFKWHASKTRNRLVYARRGIVFPRVNGKQPMIKQYLHRFILNNFDKDIIVDFKDDNPLNCQKYNLIISNDACKTHNIVPRKRKLAKGVRKHGKKFEARISINKKTTIIGYYKTEEEAFSAYCTKNIEVQKENGAIF